MDQGLAIPQSSLKRQFVRRNTIGSQYLCNEDEFQKPIKFVGGFVELRAVGLTPENLYKNSWRPGISVIVIHLFTSSFGAPRQNVEHKARTRV